MNRNCQKCIHHISGLCCKWDCEMTTLEDYRNKVIDEFANWLYENHKTDLTEYIEWYKEEITEQMKGRMSMTENEIKNTKEWFEDFIETYALSNQETIEFKKAVACLEELQQYRTIGTIEEFKALKEKNEQIKQ